MARIEFYSNGKLNRLTTRPADEPPAAGASATAGGARSASPEVARLIQEQAGRLGPLFHDVAGPALLVARSRDGRALVVPTPTLIVEGANKKELRRLSSRYGLEILDEGSQGKVLLRAPEGGEDGVRRAAAAARDAFEEGGVRAAHPNFVRILRAVGPSAAGDQPLWNHLNDGNPGVPGADVAVPATWTLTKGRPEIRVAVLDEGVDVGHPALAAAVVDQRDFVDGDGTAAPGRDDGHGTACAGIISSRDRDIPGVAPECGLVAVRIAKGDGAGGWIFDDFKTADAIDWAWNQGRADVLSNSWGGGPPVDVITRAVERARTRGRGGKGSVVAFAAGNSDGPVNFPATLPDVLAVGASNQWDERKSPTTRDGETWWGSCFGANLSLLAPGVRIATTTIPTGSGARGDGFTLVFNGTSAATPHVAAAAALILSLAPNLLESQVRGMITASADRLAASGKRDKFVGWGRLNVFAALRLARRP